MFAKVVSAAVRLRAWLWPDMGVGRDLSNGQVDTAAVVRSAYRPARCNLADLKEQLPYERLRRGGTRGGAKRNGFSVVWVGALLAVCAGSVPVSAVDEFRAIACSRFEWPNTNMATCKAYIDTLMQNLHDNNFNAVILQMRGQCDTLYPSPYEPWSPIVSSNGNTPAGWGSFDPMAYAINKAHENGLEFHAYLNAHVCWGSATPPNYCPSHIYWQHCNPSDPAHRDWLCVDSAGTPQGHDGEYVWIAPGIPEFQAYWRKQIMYVVEHYDGSDPVTRPRVDGVHFDRIRTNSTDWSHDPVSEARRLGGANPASLSFGDWTRDQFTRTLCDLYAQINENHPDVKVSSAPLGMHSGSRYTEYGYPTGACSYGGYGYSCKYQDAQGWLAAGAQDFICPQIYWADEPWRTTNPHFSQILPDWLTHNSGRHVYPYCNISATGPGLLSENDVTRTMVAQTGEGNAAGTVIWSYGGFNNNNYWPLFSGAGGPYEFPANLPAMPWKDNPTDAIILGTVTDGTDPIVDVQVTRTGAVYTALSSADGLYSFLKVPPGTYTLTYTKAGLGSTTCEATVVAGQVLRIPEVVIGGTMAPQISNVQAMSITNNSATITWLTDQTASSQVEYGLTTSYGNLTPLDGTPVTSHSVQLSGLTATTLYHYRVMSANVNGTSTSDDYTFTTSGPPQISDVQAIDVGSNGATITWTTNAPADSQVRYGLTSSYGQETTVDPSLVTGHSVSLSGLTASTPYHYQVVSTNAYGTAVSSDFTFTTIDPVTEIVIDNLDSGCTRTGSWYSGSLAAVPKIGTTYLFTSGTGLESSTTATCRWTPDIATAGLYDVYVFYQIGSNRNDAAPYTVVYDGGQIVSIRNQNDEESNQGDWFLIGEDLPFATGTAGYVECANNSLDTRYVSADAAKFVFKGSIEPPPAKATGPTPAHQATGVWTSTNLSWTAGAGATSHRVYFGTSSPGDFQTEKTGTVFDPGALLAATTYFWRIDEVNAFGTTTGDVWEFTTRDTVPADLDRDGDVDTADGDLFESCASGPGVSFDEGCGNRDFDGDGDADQSDFGVFQRCLSGAGVPVDLNCGG